MPSELSEQSLYEDDDLCPHGKLICNECAEEDFEDREIES